MGYLQAGYKSYPDYLASNWFRHVKEEAWKHSKKCCSVCGKKWDLQAHHLSYGVLGTDREWRYIRFVCSDHHRACTYILWFIKVPLTPKWIRSRYYFVKGRHKVFTLITKSIKWLWISYTFRGKGAKQRSLY